MALRVTPDVLKGRAAEYANHRDSLGETISQLDTLMSNLESEWDGEAMTEYRETYRILKDQLQKGQSFLGAVSVNINASADGYAAADAAAKKSLTAM